MANENNNASATNESQKIAKEPVQPMPIADPKPEQTSAPVETGKSTPAQK